MQYPSSTILKISFLFCLFIIGNACTASAQDTIIRNNGDTIFCKITSQDSATVYFNVTRNGKDVETFMNKSEVRTIKKEIIIRHYYKTDTSTIGLGAGLDYGGVGMNFLTYPHKDIGIFAGFGYALAGVGLNGGIKLRIISDSSTSIIVAPFVLAMYGYNTAIVIKDNPSLSKLFYGYTFGLGLDFRFKPSAQNYWTIALIIPSRHADVERYISDLKTKYNVEFSNDLPSVLFSIGLRMIVK